jgi:hypothetical protein
MNKHFDCLEYAYKNGCKVDENTSNECAKAGIQFLKYAADNQFPFNDDIYSYATFSQSSACLEYIYNENKNNSSNSSNNSNNNSSIPFNKIIYSAAKNGNIDCLHYIHSVMITNNISILNTIAVSYSPDILDNIWYSSLCGAAALSGNIECLKYARNIEKAVHRWDPDTCVNAAKKGHIECLKWAHENGCPLSDEVGIFAAEYGQLECLEYYYYSTYNSNDKNTEYEWEAAIPFIATRNGHVKCLAFICEKGYSMENDNTLLVAARMGRLKCLKYAHENGCKVTEDVLSSTVIKDNVKCLEYACKHNFPCTENIYTIIGAYGSFRCLRYMREIVRKKWTFCPINDPNCYMETADACLQTLRACSYTPESKKIKKCMEYMIDTGVPYLHILQGNAKATVHEIAILTRLIGRNRV